MYLTKFAERLKDLRLENNLSQKQLGKLTDISQGSIGKWELCQRSPTLENIAALALFFKVTADYLIGLEDW